MLAGCGTNTAALGFGGYAPGAPTAATESWNGTNWTVVNNLNTKTSIWNNTYHL